MSGPDVLNFRLQLSGADGVVGGMQGVGKAFAVSATDAQKYERAAAAAATAQVALDKATAKTTAAQTAYSAALKGAKASEEELVRLAQEAASAVAAQGVALDALKGKSAALKTLAADHASLGAQAKLTGNQTAQMSAQLQDLFVQIQAGGSPLTALIQQGSQLSAVFGGFRPALAAVATILTPTVLLLGGVGAAAAAVGAAWALGSSESTAFRQSLVLTNNAAGVTAGGVSAMAKTIATETQTGIGTAREVMQTLISSGRIGADALQATGVAATAMAKATGQGGAEVAQQFAAMASDVTGSARRLMDQYHMLTAAEFEHIKTLDQQGQSQQAMAELMTKLGGQVKGAADQLGSLERGWNSVKVAASNAWDSMLGIGRDQSLQDKIAAKVAEIERAKQGIGGVQFNAPNAQAELAALQAQAKAEQDKAKASADGARSASATRDWNAELEKSLDHQAAWTKQIAEIKGKARAAKLYDDDPEVLAKINAEYQKSAAFADSQASAMARVGAASAIAAAKTSATLQGLQQQFESGQLRLIEYTQLSGNATVAGLRAEAAAIAQSLTLAKAKRDNMAEVLSLQGQASAKQIEIATAVGKVEFDVAQASVKAYKDKAAAMVSAYDAAYAEASKATVAAADQVRALEAEATAAAMARSGYMSMAEAVERVAIARLNQRIAEEQARVDAGGDNAVLGALKKELEYRERIAQLVANKDGAARDAKAIEEATKTLDAFFAPDRAKSFAEVIGEAFDKAGGAVGKMGKALQSYGQQMQAIQKAQAAASQLDNPVQKWIAEQEIAKKSATTQIGLYADMAGAAKGFFSEGSRGYKTLQAAETAFRAYQLASDLVQGASAAAVAIARQANGDPYTAWARMAAMAAAMAALGFAVSGGFNSSSSAPSAADRQAATGTGTVLGDSTAKSDSVAKAIEALSSTARIELTVQSGMLASLRNIEASMAGLGNLVLQANGLTTGKNLGIQTGKISSNVGDPVLNALGLDDFVRNLPVIGGVVSKLQSLWGGVSRTISDAGLSINGKVSDLAGGRGVQQYADVSTTSKSFFGLVKKTTNDTQFASMGDDMAKQFGMVFTGIGDTLKAAAVALGRDGQTVGQAVADFVVDIPRLSLKDLKGADLQAAIGNAISGASDGIAKAAIAGLDGFQQVGEGYFQTLVRVASGVESARVALDAVGVATVGYTAVINKQGDVATEIVRQSITAAESAGGVLSSVGAMIDQFNGSAADLVTAYTALRDVRVTLVAMGVEASALSTAMIQGAGGLDALKSSISSYLSDFYTDAARFNIGMQQIGAELGRLGINTVPATREAFRALVEAQDRSTEAGQRTYGALIAMSGAFAEVVGASTAAADALASLTDQLKSVASAALAGVDAAVSAQKDALTSAYQADVAKVDAAIAAAKAQFEATMAEIDAQRAAAKAIYDAQVSAINSARAALDAQAASQTKAYTDATKAVDAERKAAQAAYKSAADQMSAVINAAGATVDRLRGLNDSLRATLASLHPIGSEAADRARGQAQIASALAVAKASGVLPDADALKTALEAVSKPSEDLFGSFEDYLRDFYRTSLDIRDLSDIAGTQLDGAQTQLDATLAMRDALDAANDATMTRLDGIRDALDAANDLARDQIAAARDRLDGQLAGARTTYDTTLVGLDSAAKAAQAVLDGALAQGEAQKSALKDAYEAQLAVLTDILATAKAQLAAALGIDASVKSVAQALADFAKTLGPLAALTGGKAPDAAPSQKNQWVTNGAVSTYSDTAGAVAVKAAGQDNASAAIKGVNGAVTTISAAADFIKSNTVAGNAAVVAEKAAEFGISTPNVDALAGYTPGTFAALSGVKGATIAGFSVDDIRAFVAANANDPLAIYRRAVDAGITSATLDAAMGWTSGKSLAWALANKLPAFAAGGDHAGGLAIVGEQGPELVNMGPARVWNNEQTTAMLRDPGRREAALVSEVQRLRQTVDELRSDLNASTQAIAVNTGKSARLSDRWDTDGLPATRTTT